MTKKILQNSPAEKIVHMKQGMSDADWQKMLRDLLNIDPDMFRLPVHPVTGEKLVSKGISAAHPPRHDSGNLS